MEDNLEIGGGTLNIHKFYPSYKLCPRKDRSERAQALYFRQYESIVLSLKLSRLWKVPFRTHSKAKGNEEVLSKHTW